MELESMLIELMIERISIYGLTDESVFSAMRHIRRSDFVKGYGLDEVYGDYPLEIGRGQTISQPYTVAFMLHELRLSEGQSVLEIGSGSGWLLALLKWIVKDGPVTGVEIDQGLFENAKRALKELSMDIEIISGDGSLGCRERAPFDRIIISAACPEFPAHLLAQVKDTGYLIAPVGESVQEMVRARKSGGDVVYEKLGLFMFVPLRGRKGFA